MEANRKQYVNIKRIIMCQTERGMTSHIYQKGRGGRSKGWSHALTQAQGSIPGTARAPPEHCHSQLWSLAKPQGLSCSEPTWSSMEPPDLHCQGYLQHWGDPLPHPPQQRDVILSTLFINCWKSQSDIPEWNERTIDTRTPKAIIFSKLQREPRSKISSPFTSQPRNKTGKELAFFRGVQSPCSWWGWISGAPPELWEWWGW